MRQPHSPLRRVAAGMQRAVARLARFATFVDTMPISSLLRPRTLALLVPLLVAGAPLQAQVANDLVTLRNATRPQLDSAAAALDRQAASPAYSATTRAKARAEAGVIRQRLTDGDFRPGDRIVLTIEGSLTLDDTATVLEGKRLPVKGFRQVSLTGVLRSELEPLLRSELADFVRNASVSARPLMRVAVYGTVPRQGFFNVPTETRFDDLLALAGGPAGNADPRGMTVVRSDTLIMSTDEIRLAVANGVTIGAAGIQDGDALVVPEAAAKRDINRLVQTLSFMLSIGFSVFAIARQAR